MAIHCCNCAPLSELSWKFGRLPENYPISLEQTSGLAEISSAPYRFRFDRSNCKRARMFVEAVLDTA
jgi:hypothetical protein